MRYLNPLRPRTKETDQAGTMLSAMECRQRFENGLVSDIRIRFVGPDPGHRPQWRVVRIKSETKVHRSYRERPPPVQVW